MRLSILLLTLAPLLAAPRWRLAPDGGITWTVKPGEAHTDHIEMSGRRVSAIVTYGVDDEDKLILRRQLVFPRLRTVPNDTHASLSYTFAGDATPRIFLDGRPLRTERITSVHHRGILRIESTLGRDQARLIRTVFPSTTKQMLVERWTFTNTSQKPLKIELESFEKTIHTDVSRGVAGVYVMEAWMPDAGVRELAPAESASYAVLFDARQEREPRPQAVAAAEEAARQARVDELFHALVLETPDATLNTLFQFAKLRSAESIYDTRGGLMHGPGGGAYYAAIWANDQAEYANPFFPFLGDATANESAENSFRLFARYMNPGYKPIPSSIIAEGTDFWNGAGDRGDMAMIAYGAARYALARGDRRAAESLWPLIEWSLEYSRRKVNADGVVASDSDELEGRFPAGKANLNTSSLYYDALRSAVYLGLELSKPAGQLQRYTQQADALRSAIERYFGATVEGFPAYRYYDGNTVLRAWIATPLCMGLMERKQGVIDALFSPRLWTVDGLASQAGDKTFWDRATLYALRGVFAAGATRAGLDKLTYYSQRRLLGEHVPYPIEAWPEGNQRHLAAESALYARIFTEGLFGIRPTGLRSFTLTPQLPEGWPSMSLRRIGAFGHVFDITVTDARDKLRVEIHGEGLSPQTHLVARGAGLAVTLR